METTHVFEFDDGSEVRVRLSPIAIADYFGLLEDFDASADDPEPEKILSIFRRWGDLALVDWSFPEPATGEGMLRRDMKLGMVLIRSWAAEVRRVPAPLPRGSSDGEPSEDPTSPPNSNEPSSSDES